MSRNGLLDMLEGNFPHLTAQQKDRFAALLPLYGEWNARINVLSRKETPAQWGVRHVLHSLSIARFIAFKPGAAIMDLGTGGGFPGIPLAIMFPETSIYLVDSIGKKIKVVQAVAGALELSNVRAEQIRAEDVPGRFDFVVSRAVAPLSELHGWIRNKIKPVSQHALPNGLICLKGGDLAEELAPFGRRVQVQPISDYFGDDFFETKQIVYLPI